MISEPLNVLKFVKTYNNPHYDLLLAVLQRSIDDFFNENDKIRNDAVNYFFYASTPYIFSFKSVCDILDIDKTVILNFLKTNQNERTNKSMGKFIF
ncbi:hypothetical protein CL622_05450 [archaeon]|nr:hypothetical protein [archaeon]|tara:strand:+ start:142 stop:429 length:288 start_codon:yes stop_codon:yes gene_type:complete